MCVMVLDAMCVKYMIITDFEKRRPTEKKIIKKNFSLLLKT